MVFANSGALRCTLSPDRSTLTFANANELLDHWVVALTLDIARDWTWEGFANPALTLSRDGNAIGTLVCGIAGSTICPVVYAMHPSYKAMGARAAFALWTPSSTGSS